jgi:hypothetical protein
MQFAHLVGCGMSLLHVQELCFSRTVDAWVTEIYFMAETLAAEALYDSICGCLVLYLGYQMRIPVTFFKLIFSSLFYMPITQGGRR